MAEGMTVEEFIHDTLTQIVRGVDRAAFTVEQLATINPSTRKKGTAKELQDGTAADAPKTPQLVEFELQISVGTSSEKEAKGGLKVYVSSIFGSTKSNQTSENVSRVRFAVPVRFR